MSRPEGDALSFEVVQPGVPSPVPTARQRALLDAARRVIEADPRLPPGLALVRAEVNGALRETDSGYLYLRYGGAGAAPQEFWANVGRRAALHWSSGQLSVPLDGPA